MERREKIEKQKKEIDAVKRKLQFEKEEKERKRRSWRRGERQKSKRVESSRHLGRFCNLPQLCDLCDIHVFVSGGGGDGSDQLSSVS